MTALADNPVGRLVDDLIYQGGVERAHLGWVPYDGVGREVRNGLNFTERGFGVRAAVGVSDRGHTAVSQLRRGDVDWEQIFGADGARWFHCGGIFAALSEIDRRCRPRGDGGRAPPRHGRLVRPQLPPVAVEVDRRASAAAEVNRGLVEQVDVLLGNEEDFSAALGFEIEGVDENLLELDLEAFATPPRAGGSRVPAPGRRRDDAQAGAQRDRSTTGRRSVARATGSTSARGSRRSRSSTGSGAVTRSPPGSSTRSLPIWASSRRSPTASLTVRSR